MLIRDEELPRPHENCAHLHGTDKHAREPDEGGVGLWLRGSLGGIYRKSEDSPEKQNHRSSDSQLRSPSAASIREGPAEVAKPLEVAILRAFFVRSRLFMQGHLQACMAMPGAEARNGERNKNFRLLQAAWMSGL